MVTVEMYNASTILMDPDTLGLGFYFSEGPSGPWVNNMVTVWDTKPGNNALIHLAQINWVFTLCRVLNKNLGYWDVSATITIHNSLARETAKQCSVIRKR